MKALIIEDEPLAAERLTAMLQRQEASVEIISGIDSVKSAVRWFRDNSEPDLVFLDIQLADGISFEIFEHVKISAPIIFTTAYDEYAIKAFKVNSIDYLLKPINSKELEGALNKFKSIEKPQLGGLNLSDLARYLQSENNYKKRFVVKMGEHLKTVETENISVFFSQEKVTYLITGEGKKFYLDYTLDELIGLLDPAQFFRINRKYIVNVKAITDVVTFSSSRLKVDLDAYQAEDVTVSRDRVKAFRDWLDS
mgnify:CR=1 FL=1